MPENTKEFPFTPGKPVPVEYFVARFDEIKRLERAIRQTRSGRNENNFLRRTKKLGMICETETRGEYRFVNQLYHLYVGLEALREKEGMMRSNRR